MYIDVLGLSSVSEAVHEASRMLRIGIVNAMAKGIEDEVAPTESQDRQKSLADTAQLKVSQPPETDPVSVYSSLTKRARRPIPAVPDPSLHEANPQQPDHPSSAANRAGFAPRSWSASKKAGPSILSKRNRASAVNGNAGAGSGSLPDFQPAPKREKLSDTPARNTTTRTLLRSAESKKPVASGIASREGSTRQLSTTTGTKDDKKRSHTSGNVFEKSKSSVPSAVPTTSKAQTSTHPIPKQIRPAQAARENPQSHKNIARPTGVVPSPGAARKVGLPPSWCQVSAKSFKPGSVTQSKSVLSLLRKPGQTKQKELPAAPRGSTALHTVPTLKQTGTSSLLPPPKLEKSISDNPGLIPLPSSMGIKVKYVPGSEIIDGVRPNGYTVSIDGVVKPVVTFNPKPKLPHKLRQNSVEKLFEAWRDNRKIGEGDALARALREEQEMYARATNRVDYRAAVTVKLKDIRKVES